MDRIRRAVQTTPYNMKQAEHKKIRQVRLTAINRIKNTAGYCWKFRAERIMKKKKEYTERNKLELETQKWIQRSYCKEGKRTMHRVGTGNSSKL